MTYDAWIKKVDGVFLDTIGLSLHDLPDAPYRGFYDDGLDPYDAAARAMCDYCDVPSELLEGLA